MGRRANAAEVIRGTIADRQGSSGPRQRFEAGRICTFDSCTTRLSVYNRASRCWQHESPHAAIVRAERRSVEAPEGPGVVDLPELLHLVG